MSNLHLHNKLLLRLLIHLVLFGNDAATGGGCRYTFYLVNKTKKRVENVCFFAAITGEKRRGKILSEDICRRLQGLIL